MELIVIGTGKLKIMLTDDEMKKYELDTDTIDYDTTSTRRAFWSILDDAKTRTGFDAASDRVFIQLYPSKKGGCEMYVTKLSEGGRVPRPRFGERKSRLCAYAFPDLEALLGVCRRLLSRGWRGESRAYRDTVGRCYLFLTEPGAAQSFLPEYGTRENADRLRLYIGEHGHPLCESHAVELLGKC